MTLPNNLPDIAGFQEQAINFLEITREEEARTARMKLYYIRKAREYGVPHADIGAALGVTEGAVRNMLKRNSESAA